MTLFVESDSHFITDRFNLELEAEKNAELLRAYGKRLAVASATEKTEKRKLEFKEVEVAERIRLNPSAYHVTKDTDTVVFKIAKGQPDYIDQFNIWLRAKQRVEDLEIAVSSIRQKGSMIKILAELWKNDYYSRIQIYEKDVKPSKKEAVQKYKLNPKPIE